MRPHLLFVLLLLSRAPAEAGPATEVRVFAAASLTDAAGELAAFYERRTGERVVLNLAGSSVLARQIELGARMSSSPQTKRRWMRWRGAVSSTRRRA